MRLSRIKMKRAYLTIIAIVICFVCNAETLSLKVVGVSDGDTFTGLTADKQEIVIRINGIDAPEKGQPYGKVAKQALSDLIFGQQVKVEILSTDRWKRKIAIVYTASGADVAAEMLMQGLAWHFKKYDDSAYYAKLELQAKGAQVGLWQGNDIIEPWVWRKMSKAERDLHR